jgi:hypothetical protein
MKKLALFYVILSLIGAGFEWAYGALWGTLGNAPWVYPESVLRYTSLEVVPMWGFGALVCASIYRAIMSGRARHLLDSVLPLILAALWILLYEGVIKW